jgi:hypothetical protein
MVKKILALLALSSAAGAAPLDPLIHADGGIEMEGGTDVSSVTFRAQLLLGNAFGSGRVRPEIAAGALFGDGTLYVNDPRAVDGAVGLGMLTFGPEAQLGLQFYNADGDATTRLFASVAYMHVNLDSRLMIDPVPGVGGDHGERAAFGVNFARAIVHNSRCEEKTDCDGIFYLLLPHQAEFATERDGGSTRYGFTLSWGS